MVLRAAILCRTASPSTFDSARHQARTSCLTLREPRARDRFWSASQSYAGWRVELRECLDGRLLVEAHGRRLGTAPAPPGVEFVLVPRHAARPRTVSRTRAMAPRPMSSLKALTALAQHLRQTARPHPWRQIFSRRQRTRQRHDTATG